MRAKKEQVIRDIRMYLGRRMLARFEADCSKDTDPALPTHLVHFVKKATSSKAGGRG
jgi:hypothetical protein